MRRNKNVVRMEKKATNKFGLFILLVIVVIGAYFGGKYLYDNKDSFDWSEVFPWIENNDGTVLNKDSNKSESKNKNRNQSLIVPKKMSDSRINFEEGYIVFTDVKADDKGFTFTLEATAHKANVMSFICEKVLIDNFDTTSSFEVVDYKDIYATDKQIPTKATFRINKTELDALGIRGFNYISLMIKTKSNIKETELIKVDVMAINNETEEIDNQLKGLVKIDEKNSLLVNYYETVEDKDATYIYFDFKNNSYKKIQDVRVKKLIINNEVYDYKDFSETLYFRTELISYIEIPKSKVKNVENFTVSFFIVDSSTGTKTPSYYITHEYKKEF